MHDWPFSGDVYLLQDILNLIEKFNIKTVIETGTWKGRTAQFLSGFCEKVYTIEISEEYFNEANYLESSPNITRILGNSPEVLDKILPEIEQPVLFFLDAHWGKYWPLLDELESIKRNGFFKSVIVVHDIFNPLHPEFNYDSYEGVRLDWEYIRRLINSIYSSNYEYFYNNETSGDKCGAVFIYPKEG